MFMQFQRTVSRNGNFVPFKEVKAMLKVHFMRIVKLSFWCQLSIVWIINDLYFFNVHGCFACMHIYMPGARRDEKKSLKQSLGQSP